VSSSAAPVASSVTITGADGMTAMALSTRPR
jgi:hypothetical protein